MRPINRLLLTITVLFSLHATGDATTSALAGTLQNHFEQNFHVTPVAFSAGSLEWRKDLTPGVLLKNAGMREKQAISLKTAKKCSQPMPAEITTTTIPLHIQGFTYLGASAENRAELEALFGLPEELTSGIFYAQIAVEKAVVARLDAQQPSYIDFSSVPFTCGHWLQDTEKSSRHVIEKALHANLRFTFSYKSVYPLVMQKILEENLGKQFTIQTKGLAQLNTFQVEITSKDRVLVGAELKAATEYRAVQPSSLPGIVISD